jgi:WD40 repeat protein
VWDRESGKCIRELASGHSSRVLTVVADRMRVVSAGLDSKLIIWDYADGLDTSFVQP